MTDWVVDTNVPIVANGRSEDGEARPPALACREATVRFLLRVAVSGKVLLDLGGEIQAEYRAHLRPPGQPGVGDRFYQMVLQSSPDRVKRVDLIRGDDGEFESLPESLRAINFDRSDRKFAALAHQEAAPLANATDSDWINDAETVEQTGITVHNLCGCDPLTWFVA